jgi:hypothetical protein
MIRDFWSIKKARLVDEIDALKDKVDPSTWAAIDAVRQIGNIGAHMEKDIDLIVEVEPDEAGQLIGLVETLIEDWYIARHDREERMNKLVSVAAGKKAAKNGRKSSPRPTRRWSGSARLAGVVSDSPEREFAAAEVA